MYQWYDNNYKRHNYLAYLPLTQNLQFDRKVYDLFSSDY